MTYIKAYLNLFFVSIVGLSVTYLTLLAFRGDPAAVYAVYLCSLASIAGPIAVLFNKKEKA